MTPAALYANAARWQPGCWAVACISAAFGLVLALAVAPADAIQGDAVRIAFVHEPALGLALLAWLALTACALRAWQAASRSAALLARAIAPSGALLSFMALWSGALWSKPVRGQWWVPDAGLVAQLLMLIGWLALMAAMAGLSDARQASRAGAALSLAGLPNLLMLAPAVAWWPAADERFVELAAMGLTCLALAAWSVAAVLHRVRSMVLEQERGSGWPLNLREVQRR